MARPLLVKGRTQVHSEKPFAAEIEKVMNELGIKGSFIKDSATQGPNGRDGTSALAGLVGSFQELLSKAGIRLEDGFSALLNRSDTSAVSTVNPRLGLNLRLLQGSTLHLKASAGRSFRVPTFNDRFWQPGGKPDLNPERGWTYDLGLRLEHRYGQAEATVFFMPQPGLRLVLGLQLQSPARVDSPLRGRQLVEQLDVVG